MHLPLRQRLGEILALMRAAAFAALERGRRDGMGDAEHVAQVEPFEAFEIEGGGVARRMLAELLGERRYIGERLGELCSGADWPDAVRHGRLQLRDHRG